MSIGVIAIIVGGMIGAFVFGGLFGFWLGAASEA